MGGGKDGRISILYMNPLLVGKEKETFFLREFRFFLNPLLAGKKMSLTIFLPKFL